MNQKNSGFDEKGEVQRVESRVKDLITPIPTYRVRPPLSLFLC